MFRGQIVHVSWTDSPKKHGIKWTNSLKNIDNLSIFRAHILDNYYHF